MEVEQLVTRAASALEVADLRPLRDGGQKQVRIGLRAGEQVVLKVIAVAPPQQQEVLERAHREVGLLAAIDDPRLVALRSPITAIGDDPDRPEGVAWLEEFLDGEDLADLLASAPWPAAKVADLVLGLGQALELLHQKDVVHRDLSPGNVRRRSSGLWTLMDPGYAKHLARSSITGVFQPGTLGFCSPEHAPGSSPAAHSDIFGLGILAYIVATGCYPVAPGVGGQDYITRLCTQDVLRVQQQRPDLPDALAYVIDTCLQRQPARRFLDASELISHLAQPHAAAGGHGGQP